MIVAAAPAAVYLHGFSIEPDDTNTHCDPDCNPDGWCVYTRHDGDEGGAFDQSDERDFPDYAAALSEAETRAARLGVPFREY